jgi:hypothetical protein
VRNDRPRRVSGVVVDHRVDLVGSRDFERGRQGGDGERSSVDADVERSSDAVRGPVQADRLSDGENKGLVEGEFEGRPTMALGSESDLLRWDRRIGPSINVGGYDAGYIHQARRVDGLASIRADCPAHAYFPAE